MGPGQWDHMIGSVSAVICIWPHALTRQSMQIHEQYLPRATQTNHETDTHTIYCAAILAINLVVALTYPHHAFLCLLL
jgi:hypothetical protein